MVAATGPAVPTLPVVPTIAGAPNSAPVVEALNPSEVKPPSSGTRKARVLYDYDAADSSELSLLSDEVGTPLSRARRWENAWRLGSNVKLHGTRLGCG